MTRSVLTPEDKKLTTRPRGRLKTVVRLVIGVGLIILLISQTDVVAIKAAIATSNPLLIVAAYVLHIGLLIVSAFRWRVFLEALDIQLPAATVLRLTFVGSFFNAFLPTGVGGDAYKAVRIRTVNNNLATSFASVLLDRLSGIATLAVIGMLVAILAILDADSSPLVLVGLIVSLGTLALTAALLVLGQSVLGGGQRSWFGLRPRLRRALDATAMAVRRRGAIQRSFVLGIACQLFAVGAYVAVAVSLELGISAGAVILGLLSATVAAAIPITVNGLGIREAVWVWSLGLYGVDHAEALAYALLVLVIALGTSAVGGVVYAVAGGEVPVQEAA